MCLNMSELHLSRLSLAVDNLIVLLDSNMLTLASIILSGLMNFIANGLTVLLYDDCYFLFIVDAD
jgi:hypothetical protein